jgi:hypothetical protein
VFVVRVWELQYREELIQDVTVFFLRFLVAIYVGTDTECYSVRCEGLGRAI